VLSEVFNIWCRVGARRRGAKAFQNLRKGRILGGIIRMWREEVRVSRRERTLKDTLSSMAETRLEDTLSRILREWSSWARSGKILRRMIIARTEELNRELLTMAFDGWKDEHLFNLAGFKCRSEEAGDHYHEDDTRTCTERIMVRIAEGLTPKRCSLEIVFNEWRKWCERRSTASIRRSAVSSLCAHREELAGRQILREWRSLCVRLVLLRKLAEVGGYRHRSAYLRRAFDVLKWGGLRTWRRGLAHLEGAMRSALQRRGRMILFMLLRHSARENI
ncbi:hypothetical protein FOZ63_030981, partial [Perkinsus olseni]